MSMHSFIQYVLGEQAQEALYKAASRSAELGDLLGPRVVLGWVSLAGHYGYHGEIPGIPGSILEFRKSDSDELFAGAMTIAGDVYDFQNATTTQLAATLAVALGADRPTLAKNIRDKDLVGLGKSIDLLLKARVVRLKKTTKAVGAGSEETGTVAPPAKALAPEGPAAPQQTQSAPPAQKMPSQNQAKLKITKSQGQSRCVVCDKASFSRTGRLVGCACLRELAKHARSEQTGDGWMVTFGPEWTKSNIRVFMDILGAKDE